MRSLKAIVFVAAAALAVPAGAQLRPSPLGGIYESYNDCFKVATKDGLSQDNLRSLGWSRATISKDGKPKEGGPIIYGHSKRVPLIMLSDEQGDGLCIVMAKLESANSFDEFIKPWGGKLPEPDADGAISFSADGHIVQLRKTGTAQAPSLSIAVMTPMESK